MKNYVNHVSIGFLGTDIDFLIDDIDDNVCLLEWIKFLIKMSIDFEVNMYALPVKEKKKNENSD